MSSKENNSSFKKLPQQIEWALPIMLTVITVIIYHKSGIVLLIGLTTFAIMLNGWISSKATSELYSDNLLITDAIGLCIYLCMILSIYHSDNQVSARYYLFSGLLCLTYMIWDILIKPLIKIEIWQKYYKKYVIIMAISAVIHLTLYFLTFSTLVHHYFIAISSMSVWVITLFKWHYDKSKSSLTK